MKKTLLLADDSPTIQKVINLTFADEGIDVVAVSDGNAALQQLRELRPDLIMADVHMPGLNGYEICERVRQNPALQNIPVILLVGSFEPFDEDEAKRVGADDFLMKPFQSIRQLVGRVSALLEPGDKVSAEQTANQEQETEAEEIGEEIPIEAASITEVDVFRAPWSEPVAEQPAAAVATAAPSPPRDLAEPAAFSAPIESDEEIEVMTPALTAQVEQDDDLSDFDSEFEQKFPDAAALSLVNNDSYDDDFEVQQFAGPAESAHGNHVEAVAEQLPAVEDEPAVQYAPVAFFAEQALEQQTEPEQETDPEVVPEPAPETFSYPAAVPETFEKIEDDTAHETTESEAFYQSEPVHIEEHAREGITPEPEPVREAFPAWRPPVYEVPEAIEAVGEHQPEPAQEIIEPEGAEEIAPQFEPLIAPVVVEQDTFAEPGPEREQESEIHENQPEGSSILELGHVFSHSDADNDDQLLDIRSVNPESDENTLVFKTGTPPVIEPVPESAPKQETQAEESPAPEPAFIAEPEEEHVADIAVENRVYIPPMEFEPAPEVPVVWERVMDIEPEPEPEVVTAIEPEEDLGEISVDQADGFSEAPVEIAAAPEPFAPVETPPAAPQQISAEAIEAIAQRVLEKLSEKFVRDMAPAMKDLIVDELSGDKPQE